MYQEQNEIDKLKYHLNLLLDYIRSINEKQERKNNLIELIIELDWDRQLVNDIDNIFEKKEKALQSNNNWNWSELEQELIQKTNSNYQLVKTIISAYYHSDRYKYVCIYFVKNIGKGNSIEYDYLYDEMKNNGDI